MLLLLLARACVRVSISGPQLFYVDDDGTCVSGDMFAVGSGSSHVYGLLDAELRKHRPRSGDGEEAQLVKIGVDEAAAIAVSAIHHATVRDSYSGGFINVFHINETGWHQIRRIDSKELDRNSF